VILTCGAAEFFVPRGYHGNESHEIAEICSSSDAGPQSAKGLALHFICSDRKGDSLRCGTAISSPFASPTRETVEKSQKNRNRRLHTRTTCNFAAARSMNGLSFNASLSCTPLMFDRSVSELRRFLPLGYQLIGKRLPPKKLEFSY